MSTASTDALRKFGTDVIKAIPAKEICRMKKVTVTYKVVNDEKIPVVDLEFFNQSFTNKPYGG